MTLDPNAEFASTPASEIPAVTPPVVPPAPPAVSKEEHEAVKSQLSAAIAEVDGLKGKTEILDRLSEVFGGQPTKSLDPRDAFVRKEIMRLAPEIEEAKSDAAKIKELLPQVLQVLAGATEERVAEKAVGAIDTMKDLMEGVGLDPKDDEACGYMEEVLTREIRANQELLQLWRRGDTKRAVSKAFEKAQAKLFAPVRAKVKRGAVNAINELPKASPRGNAPSPAPTARKVDVADTSREGIKKVHDAAFDRLQELMDRE